MLARTAISCNDQAVLEIRTEASSGNDIPATVLVALADGLFGIAQSSRRRDVTEESMSASFLRSRSQQDDSRRTRSR